MSLIAKRTNNSESSFEILDEGTHAAVCTWLIDIGPQKDEYQGETNIRDKVRLRFEVPAERVTWTDGEGNEHEGPKVIWTTLTNSLNEKAKLLAWLESWRGRSFTEEELEGFDLRNILGKPCMLNVVHKTSKNGKTYAKITGIGKIMKGLDPKPEGEVKYFDFNAHSEAELAELPEWLQQIIEDGKATLAELKPSSKPAPVAEQASDDDFVDDDIPFNQVAA